jgi:hypothetical protein
LSSFSRCSHSVGDIPIISLQQAVSPCYIIIGFQLQPHIDGMLLILPGNIPGSITIVSLQTSCILSFYTRPNQPCPHFCWLSNRLLSPCLSNPFPYGSNDITYMATMIYMQHG